MSDMSVGNFPCESLRMYRFGSLPRSRSSDFSLLAFRECLSHRKESVRGGILCKFLMYEKRGTAAMR